MRYGKILIGKNEGWCAERIAALKEMHKDGVSASSIAVALGGISRNAVLGKIYRLGLSKKSARRSKRFTKPTALPKKSARLIANLSTASKSANHRFWKSMENEIGSVSNADLESHHCRWPTGDKSHRTSCGAQKIPGKSYCQEHLDRATQKIDDCSKFTRNMLEIDESKNHKNSPARSG